MVLSPQTYRFTVDDYYRMGDAGIFAPDERVELIEGEIVRMNPIGSRHAACIDRLSRFFHKTVGENAVIRSQSPLHINDHSEPEPDLMLLKPRDDFYAKAHPGPDDVFLLIEVADSSLAYDRDVKLPLYARAGIAEVWMVDLAAKAVERYLDPADGAFSQIETLKPGESLAPRAFSESAIPIAGLVG